MCSICIFFFSHSCVHLATGAVLLSLYVNNPNLTKWYYQDIQEKIELLINCFVTIIIWLCCFICICDFLLSDFYVFHFRLVFVFSHIPVLSLHWPYGSYVSALIINNLLLLLICPSARCASAANAIDNVTDIFNRSSISLEDLQF